MKHKSKNEYYRGESGAGNLPHNQKEEKAPPPWGQMLSWSGPTENLMEGWMDGGARAGHTRPGLSGQAWGLHSTEPPARALRRGSVLSSFTGTTNVPT